MLLDSIALVKDPVKKADFYRLLSNEYRSISPAKADSVAKIGLVMAREQNHALLEARILFQLGNIYRQQSLFATALDYYQEALGLHSKIAEEDPENRIRVAYTYNQMGLVFKGKGEYDHAIEAYQKALKIKEDFRQEYGTEYIPTVVNTYTNIGAIYNLLEEWEFALNYHRMGEALLQTDPEKYAHSRATIYANLSHTFLQMGDLSQAEIYLEKHHQLIEDLHDPVIEAEYHANFADIQQRKGLFDKAIEHFQQAIQHYQTLEDTWQITSLQFQLGQVYEANQQARQALTIYESALSQAQKIGAGPLISEGLLRISEWYESQQDLEKALQIYKQHIEQKGQIFNENTINALKEMQVLFAPDRSADKLKLMQLSQQLQEKQIENNRMVTIGVGSGLLLTIVMILVLLYSIRTKRKINAQLENKNGELSDTLFRLNQTVEKLRESELSLSIANSTKNKMFSIVSHDLRGQLGSMMSFTELLKEQSSTFTPAQIEVFAEEFHASSKNLFNLMENLVQWAKAQMEQIEYSAEVFPLNQIIKENIQLQQTRAQDKGIALEADIDGRIEVETDANMMNFIVRNLLSNAIKFTHTGGKITLGAHREGDQVRICVSDTGMGIPDKVRKGLFKVSSHTTTRGTKNEKGTGLGLLLCDEFARKIGSPLELQTEVGKGSCFSFVMPIYAAEAAAQAQEVYQS